MDEKQMELCDVIAQHNKTAQDQVNEQAAGIATNSIMSNRSVERFVIRKKIMDVYSLSSKALTDREVAANLGVHKSEVQPRITELLQERHLRFCGDVRCHETGKMVRSLAPIWRAS